MGGGSWTKLSERTCSIVAKSIAAFFSLDLAQIRGYGLQREAAELLAVLSLWKVRQFLDSNMRLRSACELEVDEAAGGVKATRPAGFELPSAKHLAAQVGDLIKKCKPLFASPVITELTWAKPSSSKG